MLGLSGRLLAPGAAESGVNSMLCSRTSRSLQERICRGRVGKDLASAGPNTLQRSKLSNNQKHTHAQGMTTTIAVSVRTYAGDDLTAPKVMHDPACLKSYLP